MRRKYRSTRNPVDRYSVLLVIAILVFILILSKLIYLQVFEHSNYESRANQTSTRFIEQQAPRGNIYSSNGALLAGDEEEYTLEFTQTAAGMNDFFNSINDAFNTLKSNNEFSKMVDTFELQINPKTGALYFNFPVSKSTNPKQWDALKIRFMYNRGLEAPIQNKLFPKNDGRFTTEQTAEVNKILLQYTPEETFDDLAKQYGLYGMLNIGKNLTSTEQTAFDKEYSKMPAKEIMADLQKQFSLYDIRNFMVIKDTMKLQSYSGFKPVIIAKNIGNTTAAIFEQRAESMPGISAVQTPVRYYPYGTLGSHVIGYLGAIPSSEANKYEQQGYNLSDNLIGVAGIEAAEQNVLRGTTGGTMVKVNAQGQKVQTLYTVPAYPGDNVNLTINSNLEYTAQKALQQQMDFIQKTQPYGQDARMGAVVAVDPNNGNILAMASLPGYNPNDFATGKVSESVFNKYFNPDIAKLGQEFIDRMGLDKTLNQMFPKEPGGGREDLHNVIPKPLFNYATMGLVPPGSTYKIVTATAALETGATDATYTVLDAPDVAGKSVDYYDAKPNIFGATLPEDNADHENVNLVKALEVSCNTYFFNMGAKIYYKYNQCVSALNIMAQYAAKYGLGTLPGSNQKQGTGIQLPENFGDTYNFNDFKKQSIFYSKWTLVKELNKGQLGGVGLSFAPVNIGLESADSKELAGAKTKIIADADAQMDKIGFTSISTPQEEAAFTKVMDEDLSAIYKNSSQYQTSIKQVQKNNPSLTVAKDISVTAEAINDWVVDTMVTEITTPAQLGYSSLGQGTNEFTPVQIAAYAATIANGGTRYKLNLIKSITSPTGQVIEKTQPQVLDKVGLPKPDDNLIKRGMWEVDNMIQGTATIDFNFSGRRFPIPTAGKTGTASLDSTEHTVGRAAWGVYIGYAPVKNPQIAVAVVIYNGVHGEWGAPVARSIYETYFRNEINKLYPKYQPTTSTTAADGFGPGTPYSYSLHPPVPVMKTINQALATENPTLKDLSTSVNGTNNVNKVS